jgi:hypothetical protein
METFDFCIRLDDLIVGCCEGNNTPAQLQYAMVEAIEDLYPGGRLYKDIIEPETLK